MVALFIKLLSNYSERFEEVENNYLTTPKSAVNLVKGTSFNNLTDVLHNHNYITSKDDADFVSKFILQKFEDGQSLSTLYDLNKRIWQMPVSLIDSIGSNGYKNKADKSKEAIGIDDEFCKIDFSQLYDSAELDSIQHGSINVSVIERLENAGMLSKGTKPCANIVVRLSEQYIDSLDNYKSKRRTIAYLKTNDKGKVSFNGLNPNLSYSVLPIHDGFEYGTSKGTIGGNLSVAINKQRTLKDKLLGRNKNTLLCSFTQQEHKIRIFDAQTLKQIKEDKTLTIRSPREFKNILVKYVVLFFAAWWGLWLICKVRRKPLNETILAILMSLTGLCLLTMFSLNDPLTDRLLGVDMGNGILCGVAIILVMQLLDIRKFYQGRLSFDIGKFSIFIPSIVFSIIIFAVGSFYVSKNIMLAISVLLMFITFFAYKIDKEHLTNLLKRQDVEFDIPVECIKWIFKPFKDKIHYFIKILADDKINIINKLIALIGMLLCTPLLIIDLMEYLTSFLSKILIDSDVNKIRKLLSVLGIIVLLPYVLFKILYRKLYKLPKGAGYLLTALMLTALLFTPLGDAVGGMKVNLNIGILFQPSEIAKYLVIIFMAAYFSVNANKIVQFSEKGNTKLFGAKLKMMMSIFIGLGVLMGLYLVLGDMGPALVLAFTFILLYSIIKSKIDLEGTSLDNQLKRIFTCDIAMLIYGVLSFIVFLYIGNFLGNMGVFCLAWFALWIIIGVVKQEIYETPIFFNFIIAAFIFGGTLLGNIPGLGNVAERLDSRNEMCSNTWGTLPINGNIANAGENTQVAEGLWGLASGGFWGQGLGNGSTHFIPAFHTDMILESIGEQMGFVGIFIIILLLAILLRRTIVVGYETSHPFTLYLCLGIAIVTAIQFVIISLGSTGIIPLTGVTVPFLSYGKVSMILNLAAFGIILSIASHSAAETTMTTEATASLIKQNIGKYNYSVSLLSWTYCILAIFICGVFFYYQFIDRNDTLIRPVYVNNSSGIPIVEYNPRIEQLTQIMYSGDIYDRNGVLLATSSPSKFDEKVDPKDKNSKTRLEECKDILEEEFDLDLKKTRQRYYPFGEHLFFMLGDFNSKLYFSADAESKFPRGYMAESKHISDLRGYDNKMRDKDGNPIKLDLYSKEFAPDKYHSNKYHISYIDYQIRDYSALIPYLKAGLHSNKVKRLNERKNGDIEPKDIQLTIDAALQTELQQEIAKHVQEKHSHLNKLRVSVVILDGKNGDLLTSALYPLPNYDTLRVNNDSYDDINNRNKSWKAYTDMDLGLVYPTSPGSTAKVVTGLAGYRKEGNGIETAKYYIDPNEKIYGSEPAGWVDINKAYKESSNCYFVNLLNDRDLFADLAYVYSTLGVTINVNKSYTFNYHEPTTEWLSLVTSVRDKSINKYESYKESGRKEKMNNKTGKPDEWSWSWGQNGMDATPLTMARAMSVVVNNGVMPITRYTLHENVENITLLPSTDNLKQHLKDTRMSHERARSFSKRETIGGKTGTPERVSERIEKIIKKRDGTYRVSIQEIVGNDGWYICFIENANVRAKLREQKPRKQDEISEISTQSSLAIAIRMERLGVGEMSGNATRLMDEVIIDALKTHGYIN